MTNDSSIQNQLSQGESIENGFRLIWQCAVLLMLDCPDHSRESTKAGLLITEVGCKCLDISKNIVVIVFLQNDKSKFVRVMMNKKCGR